MSEETSLLEAKAAVSDTSEPPFATVYVTLTKQELIQLTMEAHSWKTLHRKAVGRAKWREERYKRVLRQLKAQAAQTELALRAELEVAQAKIKDLQQRLFGRKSERSKGGSEKEAREAQGMSPRSRGQQPGAKGHGRTIQTNLPVREEFVELDSPQCMECGLDFKSFPGTEDSEVLEIKVKAYRRLIRRRRYQPICDCPDIPGIVSAPPPSRLIPRSKFGVSVWTTALLDKFLYGRPSHRLLKDWSDHGLEMSAGTLTGGFKKDSIAPLFEPLDQALLNKLRSESHWHADETRWAVFVEHEGKVGHRWYLWVFHSPSVIHYVLDESRAADVILDELKGVDKGIISCDRYSAYKKFARLFPNVLLAFCWAHARRDYLELANAYPELSPWAMTWIDDIANLYHLNDLRLQAERDSAKYAECQTVLEQAMQAMADRRTDALKDLTLAQPAVKVLLSMEAHWPGLSVFIKHPWVPMDNNTAERVIRTPVVGRKNFYGSGAEWSGHLAATMYSLLMTVKLWELNARTWLGAYLQACADNGGTAPADINEFLPWAMSAERLAFMRAGAQDVPPLIEGIDST